MTASQAQQQTLAIARELAVAGIPIFLASPNATKPTGYNLPQRWQHTVSDPAVVKDWRPGMAMCAVMGCGLDLLDVDPRNGGDLAALNGAVPTSYATAVTPSGGVHHFIASLHVGSQDGVVKGIDVKGGKLTGEGRGFAFIAPTVRVSKVDGTPQPYQWFQPPDLADLARLKAEGRDDDSGRGLIQLIDAKRRRTRSMTPPTPGKLMQLDPGSPWEDIEATLAEGRNNGTFKLAAALRGRGGFRSDDAMAVMYVCVWPLIDQSQGGHEFTTEEFETAINSAWRYPDGAEQRATENIKAAHTVETPDEETFWKTRKVLSHIHAFALSRRVSPWAALGVILVRVIAATPPRVVLPPLVGSVASINLFIALIGESGEGKNAAMTVASEAVELMVIFTFATHTVGSGQGIAHAYARWEKGERMVRHADSAVFSVDEVDHLVGLTQQNGSTLLPELRRLYMGEKLGHLYVDVHKRAEIEPHTYRAGFILGAQPARCGVLLDDADGGTPQRFVWLPVTYPHPDIRPAQPTPWRWQPPTWVNHPPPTPLPDGPPAPLTNQVTLTVPPVAAHEVDAAALARARGHGDPLDGHRLLCRLKVAAGLAILDGRTTMDEADWALAAVVLARSDTSRAAVLDKLRDKAKEANLSRGRAEADRAIVVDDTVHHVAVARVGQAIMRHLNRAPDWMLHNDLRRALASRDRRHFEDAITALGTAGQITTEKIERGNRYRAAGRAM